LVQYIVGVSGKVTEIKKRQNTDVMGDAEQPSHLDTLKKLRIVIRAAQRHSAWIEKQCGVSGAQLWIMQELYERPGLRVGEVAHRLAIHQTTVSNLLDALGKRGYVVKARDTEDQRVVKLVLSEQGAELLQRAPKPARGLLPEALSKLNPDSLAQLNAGLQALLNVIEVEDEVSGLQPLPFTM
jgi:DNA-binding MarR family transcriptional regulator